MYKNRRYILEAEERGWNDLTTLGTRDITRELNEPLLELLYIYTCGKCARVHEKLRP